MGDPDAAAKAGKEIGYAAASLSVQPKDVCDIGDARCYSFVQYQTTQAAAIVRATIGVSIASDVVDSGAGARGAAADAAAVKADSVAKAEAEAIAKMKVENNIYRDGDVVPQPRSLSNVETRDWYNNKMNMIDQVESNMRTSGASSQSIFETTSGLRNEVKLQAREFMRDQDLASSLPPPTKSSDILLKYNGDYEAAISASKRTNGQVNQQIEIQRMKETLR